MGEPIALPGVVNASDIAWKPETDSFFLVLDRVLELHEYGPDFGAPLRVIALENGPVDAEAIAYLGQYDGLDRFALGVEANENVVLVFELDPTKLGAVAGDLSSLYFDLETNTLLVLSDRGSRLLRVDPRSGDILDQLVLDRSPQYEGVTLASGGRLVVVSEPNFVEIFTRR